MIKKSIRIKKIKRKIKIKIDKEEIKRKNKRKEVIQVLQVLIHQAIHQVNPDKDQEKKIIRKLKSKKNKLSLKTKLLIHMISIIKQHQKQCQLFQWGL